MGDGLERMTNALDAFGSKWDRSGSGRVYQCPAHDDGTPSLSVNAGTTTDVVFECHAGCEKNDILDVLGLSWPEIFGNSGTKSERRNELWMPCQLKGCGGHKVADYRYTDKNGKLLYAVARCSRKGDGCPAPFAQWVPDPDKKHGRKWGLSSIAEYVLYKLPKLVKGTKAGRRVWLVEGEKDADRMEKDFPGEVVTSAMSGAGKSKWRLEYTRYFKGASEVIIVADCDMPGLMWAQEVHGHISKVVEKVKVVCSPLMEEGADFSDHRDYGFGLDEFEVVPFDPVRKRPDMVLQVEEQDREQVVFKGYSQESVERSLVGSMLKSGMAYQIASADIDNRALKAAVEAAGHLAKRERMISPETVAFEIGEMGVSTYEKALPELLKIEKSAFSDTEKPKRAARILRQRTIRKQIDFWLNAAKRWVLDETLGIDIFLDKMKVDLERHAQAYADLDTYCEPVAETFSGDVLEDITMEEEAGPQTNVRPIRPQTAVHTREAAARGG